MTDVERMAKEEKARYQREWRAKNRDKVRAINARYWARRAEKTVAAQKEGKHGKGGETSA